MRNRGNVLFLILVTGLLLTGSALGGQTVTLGSELTDVTVYGQDRQGVTIKVEVGRIEFNTVKTGDGTFMLPTIDGFTRSHLVGEPNLPMVGRLIAIPEGCRLNVDVIASEYEEIDLKALDLTDYLMPVQPPLSKSDDPFSVPFEFNQSLYRQSGFYSLPLAESRIVGKMRSVRMGLMMIAPVAYNPSENILRVYTKLEIRVTFVGANWYTTSETMSKHYSPFFQPVLEQVDNYKDFAQIAMVGRNDLVQYPVKFLVVSDRMFEAQLQPFIQWKIKKGFTVVEAYTDVIGSSNNAIKSYIEGLYNQGTPQDPAPSFVLLVGDAQQIMPFSAGSHVTDLYFCEFTGDVFPEIYYGRWSAQNTSQLQPQIDKTLEYEQYLMPDPSYLAEVTLVAGVDGSYGPTHGNGQINYGTNLYFNAAHNITSNTWLYPASAGGGASAAIVQTISDGVGLYNYTAHCSHAGHADPSFTTADIPGLTNYHRYLLGIGNCCLPNTFGTDYSTPCFGEAFLQIQDRGGIGYIGASDNTYWDEDYWWAVGYGPVIGGGPTYEQTSPALYDGMFHDHGEPVSQHYIVNDALVFAGNLAITESNSSMETYYWEAYLLLGDPSLMTYLGIPTANNVTHDATCLLTASTYTVYADPGSYVGISVDGVIQGAAYVDSTGMVDVPLVGFSVPALADIVVSAQNRIPYMSTFQVIAPQGAYVVYDGSVVDDGLGGNGNGLVEPGESALLGVQLKNVGPDTAINVDATISSTDTLVTISDNTEYYGTIDADGGTMLIGDAFAFDLAASAEDSHRIPFDLTITGTNRDTWTGTFYIDVHSPSLQVLSITVSDPSGNNNGILDPGETGTIEVALVNDGSGQAVNVVGVLSENDQYLSISDAAGTFGTIDSSGGQGNNQFDLFTVSADPSCPMGYAVGMSLDVTTDDAYTATLSFSLTIGDRVVFYYDDFSYDQGWSGMGGAAEWTTGSPSGGGGDPSNDHSPSSDNFVLGNDLTSNGQYNSNITGTKWATSPALDCAGMSSVQMTYWHQLGIETSSYDHAYLEVYDGSSWVRLFENSATLQETSWGEEFYDLSAYADSNPGFQIRFGLGSTDGSVEYSGWNIDDIELRGYGIIGYPSMELVQTEFVDSLQPGDEVIRTLRVRNTGDGTLRVTFSAADSWITVSGDQQVIFAGDSVDLSVTLSSLSLPGGDYVGAIAYTSNDNGNSSGSIPVYLHIYSPVMQISESSLTHTLAPDSQWVYPLLITNAGPGRLLFGASCQMFQKASRALAGPLVKPVVEEPLGTRLADADKGNGFEPYFRASNRASGGPDVFGHNWIDSDEPGGPGYKWEDISTIGTAVTLGDDAFVGPLAMGFSFPYYDNFYDQLYIGSNGIITFGSGSSARANVSMPNTGVPNNFLAMWWDDLDPSDGGTVYYYSDVSNGRFIVSFVGVPNYSAPNGTGSLTFQAFLYASGKIELQYDVMAPGSDADGLTGATIGIEDAVGADGLQVVYNAGYMHDSLAVAISALNWLSVMPPAGTVEPFSSLSVNVVFDAADLEVNEYTGQISFNCNDPLTPTHIVDAALTVSTGPLWVCGDVNNNGSGPDVADLTYLVDYLFNQGPPPVEQAACDVDGSTSVDVADVTYIVDYLFSGGPPPTCGR